MNLFEPYPVLNVQTTDIVIAPIIGKAGAPAVLPPMDTSSSKSAIKRAIAERSKKRKGNAGKHWADKVRDGNPPMMREGIRKWAALLPEFEGKVQALMPRHVFPWNKATSLFTGNTGKVLYLQMLIHQHHGVVEITFGSDGFYGIQTIVVPSAMVQAFNAGVIPSITTGANHAAKYRLQKIWATAGFTETETHGTIVFTYDQAVYAKIKAQYRKH